MKNRRFDAARLAVWVVGFNLLGFAGRAGAATLVPSGGTVGDWRITYPSGISIFTVDPSAPDTIDLVKNANFSTNEGLSITFTQLNTDAATFITIDSEQIVNSTGTDWPGFQFLLVSDGAGSGAIFNSSAQVFSNIGPFTSQSFSPTSIELAGGTLSSGETANWGGADGGSLVIQTHKTFFPSAGQNANFDFKENPVFVTAVPLPPAALSSGCLLAALALVSAYKKLSKEGAD